MNLDAIAQVATRPADLLDVTPTDGRARLSNQEGTS
jgi:hypothetical protein